MQGANPVLIDTDPGLDDAIALWLALASPELAPLAVSVTGGNVGLDLTLRNARAVVGLSGRDVPVHAGADRPLIGRHAEAAHVHGADGLGGVRLPDGPAAADGLAADAIRAFLAAAPAAATLVGLGPATNLALALATAPALAARVGRIVLMSGAVRGGNITPHAEFNAACDPEALAILLGAGPEVIFATLDLTAQARATRARIAALRARPGRCLAAAAAVLEAIPREAGSEAGGGDAVPVHDACAVAFVLAPELFESEPRAAHVVLDGPERGRTIFLPPGAGSPANARLLTRIDADGFFRLLAERLGRLP